MNRLSTSDRVRIIHLLCEGMSIRAITRLIGSSKTTVRKLVVDAGKAAAWYQDRVLQSLTCKRLPGRRDLGLCRREGKERQRS